MSKPKRTAHSGPHKNHGPKRHLFDKYGIFVKDFADAGVLNKFHCYESWVLACNARGKKDTSKGEWFVFQAMSYEQQKAWFKELSSKGSKKH